MSQPVTQRAIIHYVNGSQATIRGINTSEVALYMDNLNIYLTSEKTSTKTYSTGNEKSTTIVEDYTLRKVDVRAITIITSQDSIALSTCTHHIHPNTIVDHTVTIKKNSVLNPNSKSVLRANKVQDTVPIVKIPELQYPYPRAK